LRNAIPREAYAIFTVPNKNKEEARAYFNMFIADIENEIKLVEPNIKLEMESHDKPQCVIDSKTKNNLLNSIYGLPNGVISMSKRMPGLVETSTNLASIKFIDDNTIEITTSQRSEIDSAKYDIANSIESVFNLSGAKVEHNSSYPGWTPNPDSQILKVAVASYKKLFNKQPVVRSIHAGLECGLFLEKYPYLDMISFGPTLRNVHSPDERIEIETVKKFYDLLKEIIKNSPEN